MTAHPTENPHPKRGPLWVQWDRYPGDEYPHAIVDDDEMIGTYKPEQVAIYAAQLGQDLPEGFTLGVIATGAALIAADPEGKEWERLEDEDWLGQHADPDFGAYHPNLYPVRRIAKPAKVRVKVGDAHGRTIDGKRITAIVIDDSDPNGVIHFHDSAIRSDADGMVEVDPLDGDR